MTRTLGSSAPLILVSASDNVVPLVTDPMVAYLQGKDGKAKKPAGATA